MSTIDQLVADLKTLAAPELPRDRALALANLAQMPRFDDKAYPALAPLARMAKCLGLALRRGPPSAAAQQLYPIAGALAEAIASCAVRPSTDGPPPPPYYLRD